MKIGLVCISEILKEKNKQLAFQSMTRKTFSQMDRSQAIQKLSSRILHNCKLTEQIIRHCANQGISHYRVSSALMPLITDQTLNISYEDLPDFDAIAQSLLRAGQLSKTLKVSVSSHPDQFNVLSSYSQSTVDNSISELNHQAYVLDLMGLPQDYSCPMCLHLNLSPDFKRETLDSYIDRFKSNFQKCSFSVRSRLVLENEHGGFWNAENLYNSFGEFIPLVFDNLHDSCNPSASCFLTLFKATWGLHTPVMHWSEGTAEKPRSHAQFASFIPDLIKKNLDCVWEFELKGKDKAIAQILSNYENY
jgi:UV DNA damage endonuclease